MTWTTYNLLLDWITFAERFAWVGFLCAASAALAALAVSVAVDVYGKRRGR
jgi:hypothetical protein